MLREQPRTRARALARARKGLRWSLPGQLVLQLAHSACGLVSAYTQQGSFSAGFLRSLTPLAEGRRLAYPQIGPSLCASGL